MYTTDIYNYAHGGVGNDVLSRRGSLVNADVYAYAGLSSSNDVLAFRQLYNKAAPPAVAGESVTGTATAGQGSQSVDATALLRFIGAVESGQASQTVDALGNIPAPTPVVPGGGTDGYGISKRPPGRRYKEPEPNKFLDEQSARRKRLALFLLMSGPL